MLIVDKDHKWKIHVGPLTKIDCFKKHVSKTYGMTSTLHVTYEEVKNMLEKQKDEKDAI